MKISKDMKVGDVMRNHPNTRNVFMRFGICDCCGGELSIDETAQGKKLDLDNLLENLETTI